MEDKMMKMFREKIENLKEKSEMTSEELEEYIEKETEEASEEFTEKMKHLFLGDDE